MMMGKGTLTALSCVAMQVTALLAVTEQGGIQAVPTDSVAKAEVQRRLDQIRTAWDRQQAMFRNVQFKVSWQFKWNEGARSAQEHQEYLVTKDGRFVLRTERATKDTASGDATSRAHWSFDGRTGWQYRSDPTGGHVRVSTAAGDLPFSIPTYFMPHLFGDLVKDIFEDPGPMAWSESTDGLWVLEYHKPKTKMPMRLVFDPKQDFMVTRISNLSDTREVRAQAEAEYRRTDQGFWYPVKGEYSFESGRSTGEMETTEFQLNGPDLKCQIDIPKGAWVYDYSLDTRFPDIYLYGVPRKTFEEIVQAGGRFIAGLVVSPEGRPVSGVHVWVSSVKAHGKDGCWEQRFEVNVDEHVMARTDAKGRFAMEVPEGGELYNLLLSPKDYAADMAYDVAVGTGDLKVTLQEGGTVSGWVVCLKGETKVPIPNASVAIQQADRGESYLGSEQDQKTTTDAQGRFRFEHLQTQMRSPESVFAEQWSYAPRVWTLSCDKASVSVVFDKGNTIEDLELVDQPDPTEAGSSEDSVAGVSVKAFLDAQAIHDRWKANCTGFTSLRFKVAETLLYAEGPDSNTLVEFSYIDKVQDGNCFFVRYTNAQGSPADVNSGNLGMMSFDGRFRKQCEPWSGRGDIFQGLTGAFPESDNRIQNYMGSLPIKMEGMVAVLPGIPQDHPSRRVVEQCKLEYPDGVPGLTFEFMLSQANGNLRVLPELECVGGIWCHVVERGEVKPKWSKRYWFAHDKGMLPIKRIRQDEGGDYSRMEFLEVASVSTSRGQFWYPKVATRESKHDAKIVKYELKVDEFIPDIEVPPETFDVDFQDGTRVLYFVRYKPSTQDKAMPHVYDEREGQFRGHGSFIRDKTKTLVFDEQEDRFIQVPK